MDHNLILLVFISDCTEFKKCVWILLMRNIESIISYVLGLKSTPKILSAINSYITNKRSLTDIMLNTKIVSILDHIYYQNNIYYYRYIKYTVQ